MPIATASHRDTPQNLEAEKALLGSILLDNAALAIAEQERAALQAANAAASTEQLRVHHEEAAREAAAWEAELDRQEREHAAVEVDKPSLWRRFCNWGIRAGR